MADSAHSEIPSAHRAEESVRPTIFWCSRQSSAEYSQNIRSILQFLMFKKDEEPFLRIHFGSKECAHLAKRRPSGEMKKHANSDQSFSWLSGGWSMILDQAEPWRCLCAYVKNQSAPEHRCNRWWTLFQISSFLLKRDEFPFLSLSSNFFRFPSITCNRRLLIMQIDFGQYHHRHSN